MKNKKLNIVFILILALPVVIFTGDASAFKNVRKVKEIQFKGLNYLSKYEIVNNVKTRIDSDGIVIDFDSLAKELDGNRMIARYNISMGDDRVMIQVVEREPSFIIAVKNGKQTILAEVDDELKILSRNRVHTKSRPVIVMSLKDIAGGSLSNRIKKVLRTINSLRKDNIPVYDEISEVDLQNRIEAKVKLRMRRTVFYFRPVRQYFYKLNFYVAYLDRIKYYPGNVKLIDDKAVIR